MPVQPHGPGLPPQIPESLLTAQIILLEEALRDDAAWQRRRASNGATPAEAMPRMNTEASRLALKAMALHESVFLVLAGLFGVRNIGPHIEFFFTARGLECLRNRVITTPMQADTEYSLRQDLLSHISNLRKHDRQGTSSVSELLSPALLDDLAERFLDTFFSIGSYMRRSPSAAPLIGGARAICRWFVLLELVRLAGEMTLHPSPDLVERLSLDPRLLTEVLAERANALPSDQGIHCSVSGALSLGTTGLAHAIHCCKSAVLSAAQARKLGTEFEDGIKAYVREQVRGDDYLVREGFQRSANGAGAMYDCDLILYDVKRRKIFFVQAKWKRDSRTATLDDELHDWGASNWPLTKGIERLTALRARLGEPVVLDQVRAALNDIELPKEHILANSHFIVVHTLPFFLMHTKSKGSPFTNGIYSATCCGGEKFNATGRTKDALIERLRCRPTSMTLSSSLKIPNRC